IRALGPRVVVVKGGHLPSASDAIDVVCSPDEEFDLHGARIDSRHTHGTGCTFAAAIAAHLALGEPVADAIRSARAYLDGAIRSPRKRPNGGPMRASRFTIAPDAWRSERRALRSPRHLRIAPMPLRHADMRSSASSRSRPSGNGNISRAARCGSKAPRPIRR